MPEHIHFVIFITEATGFHLGEIISWLKAECSRGYYASIGKISLQQADGNPLANGSFLADGSFMADAELPSIFEERYHDRILLKQGQLDRILKYVSDNPRRRLERMAHRSFHCRHKLQDNEGNCYEAYGNIHLLEDPDIEAVKISRRDTPEQLHQKKLLWLRTIQNGGVLVSPFISKEEKNVRNWAYENGGRIIYIVSNGFGVNYSPKEPQHSLCSEGRLLIIAPAEHVFKGATPSRNSCMKMNGLARRIAGYEKWARMSAALAGPITAASSSAEA
jgi:hypothetical protein